MDFLSTSDRYQGKKLNVNASKKRSGQNEIQLYPECTASDSNCTGNQPMEVSSTGSVAQSTQ